jgi:macrolide transport system ATP-binding/permease protein
VDGNFFATFGIRILSGRVFKSGDRETDTDVVVVNRKMAETFWPGEDAVGKSLLTGDPPRKAFVIGIAADSKYEDLDEPPRPAMYFSLSQRYQQTITLVARTKGDPRLLVEPIEQTLRAAGVWVPFRPLTFNDLLNFNLLMQRVAAGCVASLSALALLLAVLGLFGAVSYSVSERKKELGLRVALGAQSWELLKMILRQTLRTAGTGVGIGIVLGVAATILFRSQFHGITAIEWTVLVPVAIAMLAVSLLVAYLSARPWLTTDPMEAVRQL